MAAHRVLVADHPVMPEAHRMRLRKEDQGWQAPLVTARLGGLHRQEGRRPTAPRMELHRQVDSLLEVRRMELHPQEDSPREALRMVEPDRLQLLDRNRDLAC